MADNTLSPFWTNDGCDPQNCEHFKAWLEAQRNQDLSTDNPQEMVVTMDNPNVEVIDPPQVEDQAPTEAIEDPNRNEKGQFVNGNTASIGNSGRPCEYCQRKEEVDRISKQYLESGMKEDKPKMVFINELAMKLGVYKDIVTDWKNKKNDDGSLEHPEFNRLVKEIESLQELRLQQRLLGRYNPTGSIFLLKTKHGYMETSKQVFAGDKNEPLQIEIIEEGKQIDAE